MKIISSHERRFQSALKRVRSRAATQNNRVERAVQAILKGVARGGNSAVIRYTNKFDKVRLKAAEFLVQSE